MRTRAYGLGGTMDVESVPGEGTTVEVRFPVSAGPTQS
jgi:signal transduction histidine kinase